MVIAACGSGAAHRGRTVVYASGADLQSVNPLLTVHPFAKQVERYVLLTTLVRYDSALVPRPYLARAWTWSEDRKSLTFRLQPGVRWSDGVPTTARDVAWTLSAARDAATGDPRLNDFADVAVVQDRFRRDPARACGVRPQEPGDPVARLPADHAVGDRLQCAQPAVRRRPRAPRRGARARSPGDRGRLPLRLRRRGGRPGATGRSRVRAVATHSDEPRLAVAAAQRPAYRVRVGHPRELLTRLPGDESSTPR